MRTNDVKRCQTMSEQYKFKYTVMLRTTSSQSRIWTCVSVTTTLRVAANCSILQYVAVLTCITLYRLHTL
jgi:hypothetical protein